MKTVNPLSPPTGEHPFAPFVRTLGRGKTGSRSLQQAEARQAFAMILNNEVEPLQLGAFLMLLRVKEETGDELAGFVQACRQGMNPPPPDLDVDLDWSSYAGKKHQHPWYLLSVLLLTQAGYRVLLHGSDGHTPGRLYTEAAMRQLQLPLADNWEDVATQLATHRLSYLPLRHLCLPLHELLQLKPLLGLRSPVNTLVRMLNPLSAPCSLQSVFHPAYAKLHQHADRLLGQPRAMVFKGESGEIEVKPPADTVLHWQTGSESGTVLLPRTGETRVAPVPAPNTSPLRTLWRGEVPDPYGEAATTATTAAALLLLGAEPSVSGARRLAANLWEKRDRGRLN
jgi:anthranilate phosphoribosyltransferase